MIRCTLQKTNAWGRYVVTSFMFLTNDDFHNKDDVCIIVFVKNCLRRSVLPLVWFPKKWCLFYKNKNHDLLYTVLQAPATESLLPLVWAFHTNDGLFKGTMICCTFVLFKAPAAEIVLFIIKITVETHLEIKHISFSYEKSYHLENCF